MIKSISTNAIVLYLYAFIIASLISMIPESANASPFDGDWHLDKSMMKHSEHIMRQSFAESGLNSQQSTMMIKAIERIYSNILINNGEFVLSANGKSIACAINGPISSATISCDNGHKSKASIKNNDLIFYMSNASIYLEKK